MNDMDSYMYLASKNRHPRDIRVKYRDNGHKYWIDDDDTNLVGCTELIKKYFEPFDKENAAKCVLSSSRQNDPEYKNYGKTKEQLFEEWTQANKRGSKLHDDIEKYLNNMNIDNNTIEFKQFLDFYKQSKSTMSIYRTEWRIFSDILRISGSIDALFQSNTNPDEFILVDWKRCNKIDFEGFRDKRAKPPLDYLDDCRYIHYSLQLNLYRRLLELHYDKKIIEMFLIVCHPENPQSKFIKIPIKNMDKEIDIIIQKRIQELIRLDYDEKLFSEIKAQIEIQVREQFQNDYKKKALREEEMNDDGNIPNTKRPKFEELSTKQREAFEIMENGKNIFITSAGGYGKTFLIKKYVFENSNRRNIGVTSTTGISAILINGTTLHSFLGIGLGKETYEVLFAKICRRPYMRKRWLELDTLIIDEISMLSPVLFDKLEMLARAVRRSTLPFGGIQLILSGDFFQLPNIDDDNLFCFDAKMWAECVPNVVCLDQNFRQDDVIFQKCLTEVRHGKVSDETDAILKSRENVELVNEFGILPTKIYSLNANVDYENQRQLDLLFEKNSKLEFYEYELTFENLSTEDYDIDAKIKKACNAQPLLQLCVGAQVMLLYNMDLDCKLVNGSRGVVVGFKDEFPMVKFLNGQTRLIIQHVWTVEEKGKTILTIEQIPLRVSYAVSIHKTQGITIDYAIIDFEGIFENGQAYVALSRVRSLEGLTLRNYHKRYIKAHPRVIKYYRDLAT